MSSIPENFRPVWQRVVQYDAVPTRTVRRDDEAALRQLTESLLAFAAGRDLWLDSTRLPVRPAHVAADAVADALRQHVEADDDLLACAADQPEPVWALIGDEYCWLLFEDA